MSAEKVHPEGLLGKKLGMTHIYTEAGECVPVTVIQTGPCYVLQVKTPDKDGYSAVQLGFAPKKQQRVNKPGMGHFAKAGKGAFYHVREVRCEAEALGWNNLGKELRVEAVFKNGERVDISGVSVGLGFSGVFRRHHMKGQPSTRGTHEDRRNIGAIGCRKFPGEVFKGKRMAGHEGDKNVTIQNLTVMGVRADDNVLLVKGGIPGAKGGLVIIRKAIKGAKQMKAA